MLRLKSLPRNSRKDPKGSTPVPLTLSAGNRWYRLFTLVPWWSVLAREALIFLFYLHKQLLYTLCRLLQICISLYMTTSEMHRTAIAAQTSMQNMQVWKRLGGHTPLLERERQREHSLHRAKMQQIKQRSHSHLPHLPQLSPEVSRKKRLQLEKFTHIRYENQLLLKKMIDIGNKPTSVGLLSRARNSLNRRSRIAELTRISAENRSFVQRLKRTNSAYSVKRWAEERGYNSSLRKRLSENSGRVPRLASYDSFDQSPTSSATRRKKPKRPLSAESKRSQTAAQT